MTRAKTFRFDNLKAIDKGIGELRGVVGNTLAMAQAIAVAIVAHAFGTGEGQGSGDVSRASKLVQALPNAMNRSYLIRWFEQAGIAIGTADNGYPAKAVSKDSKRYKAPAERLNFANANNWFDAVAKDGTRAPWYQGPTPQQQEPNTLLEFSDNVLSFVDRTAKAVKEGTLRNSDKPLYVLNDDERVLVNHTLGLIRRIGTALNANASIKERQEEITRLTKEAEEGLALIQNAPAYEETGDEPAQEAEVA